MKRRGFLKAFAATVAASAVPSAFGLSSIKNATRAVEKLVLPSHLMPPPGYILMTYIRPKVTGTGDERRPVNAIAQYLIVGDNGELVLMQGGLMPKKAFPKLWNALQRSGMTEQADYVKSLDSVHFRLPDLRGRFKG